MTLRRSEIVTNYNNMTGKDYTSMLTIEWEKVSDTFTIRLDDNKNSTEMLLSLEEWEALNKMMNEVKRWM